jgi:hypothetical protein
MRHGEINNGSSGASGSESLSSGTGESSRNGPPVSVDLLARLDVVTTSVDRLWAVLAPRSMDLGWSGNRAVVAVGERLIRARAGWSDDQDRGRARGHARTHRSPGRRPGHPHRNRSPCLPRPVRSGRLPDPTTTGVDSTNAEPRGTRTVVIIPGGRPGRSRPPGQGVVDDVAVHREDSDYAC